MKIKSWRPSALLKTQDGKIGYAIFWLLGVPLPVLLIIYFLRGCD